MRFYKRLESFFSQLQYGLAIQPESTYLGNRRIYGIMIPPEIFVGYQASLKFDYPFHPVFKTNELFSLMKKEGVSVDEAFQAINEFKTFYWSMPVSLAGHTEELLELAYKKDNSQISPNEIFLKKLEHIKYLEEIREGYLELFVNKIKGLNQNDSDSTNNNVEDTFPLDLKSIVLSEKKFEIIKDAFEHNEITLNGRTILTKGKAYKLISLLTVLANRRAVFFKIEVLSEAILLEVLNSYLKTNYASINKRGVRYNEYLDEIDDFISKRLESIQ